MAQFAVPDADSATGVGWSSSGFARLDEGAPGGGDVATAASGNASSNLDKGTTDITDPAVSTGHVLRARWRRSAGNRTMNGRLELWQGVPGSGTLIATLAIADIATSLTIDAYTLTGTEADNITDYAAIQLRAYYTYTGGGSPSTMELDFIELETPDATGGTVSLSGSGPNASDGKGTLHRNRLALSGDGSSASDGVGTLSPTRGLVGSGPNTSEGRGLLGFRVGLSGSGASSSDGRGVLSVKKVLSGSGPNTSDGRGDVDLTRGLIGSGPNASDGVGTLHRNRLALAGSAPNSSDGRGDLTVLTGGVVSLFGSGANASDGRGNLGFRRSLVGSGAVASDGRGAVDLTLELVGSGAASSDGRAVADLTRGLSGSGDSASEGRGLLTATRSLWGSGAVASDGRGNLTVVFGGVFRIEPASAALDVVVGDSSLSSGVDGSGSTSSRVEGG